MLLNRDRIRTSISVNEHAGMPYRHNEADFFIFLYGTLLGYDAA